MLFPESALFLTLLPLPSGVGMIGKRGCRQFSLFLTLFSCWRASWKHPLDLTELPSIGNALPHKPNAKETLLPVSYLVCLGKIIFFAHNIKINLWLFSERTCWVVWKKTKDKFRVLWCSDFIQVLVVFVLFCFSPIMASSACQLHPN